MISKNWQPVSVPLPCCLALLWRLCPVLSTAIEAYKTDGLSALGLILGAGVAIWGLKKLGTKMGWF